MLVAPSLRRRAPGLGGCFSGISGRFALHNVQSPHTALHYVPNILGEIIFPHTLRLEES